MITLIRRIDGLFARIPEALPLLFARIVAGHVFWVAGETRRAEGTWFSIMAPITMTMEHLLPILLVLGLFGRFAALGMAAMTLVIQLFIYPDAWWTEHSLWLAPLLFVMVRGPGKWSLDRWVMGRGAMDGTA